MDVHLLKRIYDLGGVRIFTVEPTGRNSWQILYVIVCGQYLMDKKKGLSCYEQLAVSQV